MNILQEHMRIHKPSIIGLVETRISGRRAQEVCDKIGFTNCFRVEAQGFQEGIWVLWNSHEVEAEIIDSRDQFVIMEIIPPKRRSWLLTVIYASPHFHLRDALWQDLQRYDTDYHKPWLLAGDFNETVCLEERNHGRPEMLRRCNRFKYWIENNRLIDLGFSGPKF